MNKKLAALALVATATLAVAGPANAAEAAKPALPQCTQTAIDTQVTDQTCTWTVAYANGHQTTYVLGTNGKVRVDAKNSF